MKKRSFLSAAFLAFLISGSGEKRPVSVVSAAPAMKAEMKATVVPTPVPTPQAVAPKPSPAPGVDVSLESPTKVIQRYIEELRGIVDPEGAKDKGKKDPAKERAIADKVRQFFDFDGLARMALGRHWNTATAAQRKEYKEVFVTLVEDSYLKRSRDLVGKYEIVFGREEVRGNRAKVMSRVVRNDADVEIVYELHRKPKNWMIYNIVLDGVDLIRNYQTQFNSIILKNGWDSLISRLRKKKDEINADVTL